MSHAGWNKIRIGDTVKKTILSNLIVILLFLSHTMVNAQLCKPFPEGLGIELGAGHNQLYLKSTVDSNTGNRLAFTITPNIRLFYHWQPVKYMIIMPFTGYNKFGGKSDPYSNEYIDSYWFEALEYGLIGQFVIRSIQIGIGIKGNYHFDVKLTDFGAPEKPAGLSRTWHTRSVMDEYAIPMSSADIGARISIRLGHLIGSAEAWFGLTNMVNGSIFDPIAESRENHYRVLIGYVL